MLQSATRLILRFLAYILVSIGFISVDAGSFLATDPDIVDLASLVLGAIVAELAMRSPRIIKFIRARNKARRNWENIDPNE